MIFALDTLGFRTYIENARSGKSYYCIACGLPLIVKNEGTKRAHHYAHKPGSECVDSWERSGWYDMSEWHQEWQDRFPQVNQEVYVKYGDIKHRADVLTGHTVIEFQHSPLSVDAFDKRNNFYHSLGFKMVWLFDLIDDYEEGSINQSSEGIYYWETPRRTFEKYDLEHGQIELFLQIKKEGEGAIIKVKKQVDKGFTRFLVSNTYSIDEFVSYFNNGTESCELPSTDYQVISEEYEEFKKKYNIQLTPQQDRCVQAIDGCNLVLAVPGSGKTKVLISRVAYMIKCKGIDPRRILSLTYTKNAAAEMKRRYEEKFGKEDKVDFRTLNSLTYNIVNDNADFVVNICDQKDVRRIITNIFKETVKDGLITENEIKEATATIAYIKNMMLSKEETEDLKIWDKPANDIYEMYQSELSRNNLIDHDDTMIYTLKIFEAKPHVLDRYQNMYEYCLLDEAQDTSKIQFEVIKKITGKYNKVFMVGDEDQSIYRFRAAYPEELLDFENRYPNPFRMEMTENFRSRAEIVEVTNEFIKRNTKRYEKEAHSDKGEGGTVEKILVRNRKSQFNAIEDVLKNNPGDIAFLVRNNDSALPIMDAFIKKGIRYNTNKKGDFNLLTSRITSDIIAFFKLAVNRNDVDSFMQIFGKCNLFIKRSDAEGACEKSRQSRKDLLDSLIDYMNFDRRMDGSNASKLKALMDKIVKMKPVDAIDYIVDFGYGEYIKKKKLGGSSLEILSILSKDDIDAQGFLHHMDSLKESISTHENGDSLITVSTIHASKGLQYNTVCILDVIDHIFPLMEEGDKNPFMIMADDEVIEETRDELEEERRIFYVAMTRAEKKLILFSIANRDSSFVEEIRANSKVVYAKDYEDDEEENDDVSDVGKPVSELCDKVIFIYSTKKLYPCYLKGKVCSISDNNCPCDSCKYRSDATVFVNDAYYDNRAIKACKFRFADILGDFDLLKDKITNIERNAYGCVCKVDYIINGEKKSLEYRSIPRIGSTIEQIIDENQTAQVIIVRNIRTGIEFKIGGLNNLRKYGSLSHIYGYYKKKNGDFNKERTEVYYAFDKEWILEWMK